MRRLRRAAALATFGRTARTRRTISAVSAIIKVHISTCPECGTNEWPMAVPDEVARKTRARSAEPTGGDAFRRGLVQGTLAAGGWLGGRFTRIMRWRTLTESELSESPVPSQADAIVCANCGHAMSMAQGDDTRPHGKNQPLT